MQPSASDLSKLSSDTDEKKCLSSNLVPKAKQTLEVSFVPDVKDYPPLPEVKKSPLFTAVKKVPQVKKFPLVLDVVPSVNEVKKSHLVSQVSPINPFTSDGDNKVVRVKKVGTKGKRLSRFKILSKTDNYSTPNEENVDEIIPETMHESHTQSQGYQGQSQKERHNC